MLSFLSCRYNYLPLIFVILLTTACDSTTPTDDFSELNSLSLAVEVDLDTWLWSADGTEIFYVSKDGPALNNVSIRAINVTTRISRIIVPDLPDEHIVRFGFTRSTDGQYIIYKSHVGEPSIPALHRVAVDGNSPPETLFSGVHTDAYAFSPDMTQLAFNNNELAWNEVRILNLDTQEAFNVSGADTDINEISWSPDGTSILVGSTDLCRFNSSTKGATELSLIDLESRGYLSSFVPCSRDQLIEVSPLSEASWRNPEPAPGVLLQGGTIARFKIPSGIQSDVFHLGTTYGPGAHVGWSPDDKNVTYWQRTCTETKDVISLEGTPGQECIQSEHHLVYAWSDTGESRKILSFEIKRKFPSGAESGKPRFSPDGSRIAFIINKTLHVMERP